METQTLIAIVFAGSFGAMLALASMLWHAHRIGIGEKTPRNYLGAIIPPAFALLALWSAVS